MIDTDFQSVFDQECFEALKALLGEFSQQMIDFEQSLKEAICAHYINQKDIEWERVRQADFQAYTSDREAARAKAYNMQMTHEKARQAMRRRKLLHC